MPGLTTPQLRKSHVAAKSIYQLLARQNARPNKTKGKHKQDSNNELRWVPDLEKVHV